MAKERITKMAKAGNNSRKGEEVGGARKGRKNRIKNTIQIKDWIQSPGISTR